MKIIISNSSDESLYQQVATQIKSGILKGELEPGELLPSIRSLAKELQISVITTKRAYEELEREGFIETVVGKGSFVAAHNKELLLEKRLKIVEEKIAEVVAGSKIIGIGFEDLQEMVRLLWEEEI